MPYRQLVNELCEFLDGDTDDIVQAARGRACATAADELEFERAARLRDRLVAVRKAIEKQQMVADRNEDLDVIGIADDELEAAVQVFYVRKGRVVGRKGFILDKVRGARRPGELIDRILEEMYGDEPPLGHAQAGARARATPRTSRRTRSGSTHLRGSQVQIRVPQRGDKRDAARDGHPQRQARSSPATGCGGPATTTPAAGRSPSCRTCSACPRRRCASSATTWPPPGHRLRRVDGGARGRPAEQARVPPLQGEGRAGQRRLRGDGGGAHPAPHGVPRRARPADRRARREARQVRLPAAAAARRRRQGPARRGRAGRRSRSGSTDEIPVASLAKRFEEVYVPGPQRAGRACPAAARRCSCCNASATRRTGSPTRSTASCAASA